MQNVEGYTSARSLFRSYPRSKFYTVMQFRLLGVFHLIFSSRYEPSYSKVEKWLAEDMLFGKSS